MLINEREVVLCHSRRAFSEIKSHDKTKLEAKFWAAESMQSQKQPKIIFAAEFYELFAAVSRLEAWPFFQCQAAKIGKEL